MILIRLWLPAIAPHPGVAHFSKWSCKAIKGFDKDEKGAEFFDYPGRLANLEASQCMCF
jgi:hypothetical protein